MKILDPNKFLESIGVMQSSIPIQYGTKITELSDLLESYLKHHLDQLKVHRKLQYKKFQYIDEAIIWVNENQVDVVNVTYVSREILGVMVIYREK